jgi:hypothetical protein
MNRVTSIVAMAIALAFTAPVAGCSGSPILAALETGPRVPSDGVVLGPNEKITLNALTAKQRQYFCSNGAVLRCERLGSKLYCSCPGTRSQR